MSVGHPSWRIRRRVIVGSALFGAFVIVYVMLRWDDTRLAETLVLGGFGLISAVVATYAGLATWEDVRLRRTDNTAAEPSQDWQPH